METRIAENIRSYRKQRGLTQEQLAEVLGVSVGAVYKWESKSSLPELRLIMEMADFFEVSVDALLGYQMKDNRLNATVERLWKASDSLDYDALSEAEKAIRKYPHHIHKKYWRRGFAKEAARAVRDWAFTNTAYNALYLRSFPKETCF